MNTQTAKVLYSDARQIQVWKFYLIFFIPCCVSLVYTYKNHCFNLSSNLVFYGRNCFVLYTIKNLITNLNQLLIAVE